MKKFLFLSVGVLLLGAGCSQATQSVSLPVDDTSTKTTSTTPPVNTTASSTQLIPTSTSMIDKTHLSFPGVLPTAQTNKKILIKTTIGNIEIQLMPDQGPKAASNFVYLVQHHFYDGIIFHRVIPGFMIQGGDPTGTGLGGPGYQFANDPVKVPYVDGVVAMANAGRDTNGSQFFIMVQDYPLGPDYSIFGKVVSRLDIAHKISQVDRDGNDRPFAEVKMISVTVEK